MTGTAMGSTWASATNSDRRHSHFGGALWAPRSILQMIDFRQWLLMIIVMSAASSVMAEEVYFPPDRFVADAFDGAPPGAEQLWIAGELRDQATAILGHPPSSLRTRYWRKGPRTAWILEEIGKEQPITAGFIVADGRIETVRILIYRESRGWEIRHGFFTRQFEQARLEADNRLDRPIDGIAGATLSVSAMRRLSRLALLYHRHVTSN